MRLLQRLKKLEESEAKTKAVKILFQECGESREACIKRHGYAPDDRNARFILVTWLDANL
jgi:hypothetical protein